MFTVDSESQLGRRRIANEEIAEHGVKGLKFHPSAQGFLPYDRMAWTICKVIAERKLPAIFHSGIGSDFPLIAPERWMKDFDEAGFKPKVKPQILKDNAVRLLGLG
jgi:predicted TIM-barrel fold metal-dependent hydrolase